MAKKRKIDDDNFYLGFSIHSTILNQDLKVVKKSFKMTKVLILGSVYDFKVTKVL